VVAFGGTAFEGVVGAASPTFGSNQVLQEQVRQSSSWHSPACAGTPPKLRRESELGWLLPGCMSRLVALHSDGTVDSGRMRLHNRPGQER